MKAKELLSEENREKLQAEAAQKSSEWKNELTVQLAEVQKELQHWKTKAAALLEENKLEDFLDKAEDKLEDLQEDAELAVEKLKLKAHELSNEAENLVEQVKAKLKSFLA